MVAIFNKLTMPGEMQGALDKAVASGKLAVVDVVSDINGLAPRAWIPA